MRYICTIHILHPCTICVLHMWIIEVYPKGNMKIFSHLTSNTQNIFITFVQRRLNVFDVGPTLYKCFTNGLCLQGSVGRILSLVGLTYSAVIDFRDK